MFRIGYNAVKGSLDEEKEGYSRLGFEHLVSGLGMEIISRLCEPGNTKAEVVSDSEMIDLYVLPTKFYFHSRHSFGERKDNWN